jgi:hypothetical protein
MSDHELDAIAAIGRRDHDKNLWFGSLAAVAVAHCLDTASSWGKREANGLLQGKGGRFDERSLTVKAVLVGGYVAIQDQATLHNPAMYRWMAGLNAMIAAVYGVVAARNFTIPR